MDVKKYRPVNVDMETHAELLKRKEETHVSLTKQIRVLVLGENEKPVAAVEIAKVEAVSDGQPAA